MEQNLNPSSGYLGLESVRDGWSEGMLVLMYHSVGVPPLFHPLRGLHVVPRLLDRQISELEKTDFATPATVADFKKEPLSVRRFALTFDDAYRNVFRNALPVLQQRKLSALTYVVASFIGKSNGWDRAHGAREESLMDGAEILDWIGAGQEIGSHGLTHRNLTLLSPGEARQEIVESKKRLEELFGNPILHFCYPYGAWNQQVRDMVEEAGYETATSVMPGFNTAETDPFAIRRFLAQHKKPWLAALLRC